MAHTPEKSRPLASKLKHIYAPRLISDHIMVQEDFERLHKFLLETESLSEVSDDMRVLLSCSRGLVIPSRPWNSARVDQDCRTLPACQTILNAVGDLLAYGCQVEKFLFAEDIFGFFGKLPINHRLVPKVVIPIHDCHCA